MNMGQSFLLALKSLAISKMRAILTMLGIIIGVAAVIIIISLGDGMQSYVNESFRGMGANLVMVTVTGRSSSRNLTEEDMYQLADDHKECIQRRPLLEVAEPVPLPSPKRSPYACARHR